MYIDLGISPISSEKKMDTKITVMNNKNSSPKANLENEKREKGLIIEDYQSLDGVNEILEILENEGIIKNSNLDRIDGDKRSGHAHYYFDSPINNNTLKSIINDYVNNGNIDKQAIAQAKGQIMANNTIDQLGILDTPTQGFNIDAQTSQLLNENIDNFQYITKDKNGITTHKKFSENLGLSGADKPTNLLNSPSSVPQLQGIYDFTFNFDTDIEQFNISNDAIKTALENALNRYNNPNLSLLNLSSSIKGNSLNINFNNLLKNPASNDFFMVSKKNIKDVLEIFLKELAQLTNLTILNNGFKFYKDQAEIDQILNRTANKQAKKSGQPTTQATTTPTAKATAQGETLEQVEVEKYIDYLAELKTKSIDEVIAVETTLKENAQKLESVKGILSDEVINEKNKEIADKLVLLDIVKTEKLEEIRIKETLDEANKELATTKAELEKTTQELTTANADNKRLDAENKEQSKRIDVISKDLDTTKKDLEQSKATAAQTAAELKASKELNEKGKKYAEQQGIKIEELTTEKKVLQTENQKLQDEINMLNEENERLVNENQNTGNNSNNNKKGNNNGRAPK